MDNVKTDESRKSLVIADELLERLRTWKQTTDFSEDSDWIFASPLKAGKLPYSYTGVWRELDRASEAAGLGHMGTHTFRHSYRMWLDAIGTPIGVQQKLMRHSDIRTTINIYGDAATEDMREAQNRIVGLALHVPAHRVLLPFATAFEREGAQKWAQLESEGRCIRWAATLNFSRASFRVEPTFQT